MSSNVFITANTNNKLLRIEVDERFITYLGRMVIRSIDIYIQFIECMI